MANISRKSTTDLFQMQAQQIQTFLAQRGVNATVWRGTLTPRFIQFVLTVGPQTSPQDVRKLAEPLAMSLGVEDVNITREGATLRIDVPRSSPQAVSFPALLKHVGELPPYTGLAGMDMGATPLALRLDKPSIAHALVAGTTGSGKSNFLRSLALSMAQNTSPDALQIAVVDIGEKGLGTLDGLPHLWRPIATEPNAAGVVLAQVAKELEARRSQEQVEGRIVIFVDELVDMLRFGGQDMIRCLEHIVTQGLKHGIHLVAATQKPVSNAVGSIVKANFPTRVLFRVMSRDDALVAAGCSGTDAHKLLGLGDGLLITCGKITRFQAPLVSDPKASVAAICKKYPTNGGNGQSVDATAWREQMAAHLPDYLPPANGGGRPRKPVPDALIACILRERGRGETMPSTRKVRELHKRLYGADMTARRVKEALALAEQRIA